MSMQGSLSIERMCQRAGVSRAGFYRSLQEEMPAEEDMAHIAAARERTKPSPRQ
jgi:hypothetical protein